ncbi:hypothetical protein [Bufonid herpesvirus 1]|uniref:hypothetical protein n=1 Tax=Bufonid herpesvirus 1 TaxID=2282206 RepID=UPI000EB68BC1|nr:hypothetical protein [Bufonid herpesvirus 1]AXF48512.1 hypothetical protein [Bufonid herpesvirus 1]
MEQFFLFAAEEVIIQPQQTVSLAVDGLANSLTDAYFLTFTPAAPCKTHVMGPMNYAEDGFLLYIKNKTEKKWTIKKKDKVAVCSVWLHMKTEDIVLEQDTELHSFAIVTIPFNTELNGTKHSFKTIFVENPDLYLQMPWFRLQEYNNPAGISSNTLNSRTFVVSVVNLDIGSVVLPKGTILGKRVMLDPKPYRLCTNSSSKGACVTSGPDKTLPPVTICINTQNIQITDIGAVGKHTVVLKNHLSLNQLGSFKFSFAVSFSEDFKEDFKTYSSVITPIPGETRFYTQTSSCVFGKSCNFKIINISGENLLLPQGTVLAKLAFRKNYDNPITIKAATKCLLYDFPISMPTQICLDTPIPKSILLEVEDATARNTNVGLVPLFDGKVYTVLQKNEVCVGCGMMDPNSQCFVIQKSDTLVLACRKTGVGIFNFVNKCTVVARAQLRYKYFTDFGGDNALYPNDTQNKCLGCHRTVCCNYSAKSTGVVEEMIFERDTWLGWKDTLALKK